MKYARRRSGGLIPAHRALLVLAAACLVSGCAPLPGGSPADGPAAAEPAGVTGGAPDADRVVVVVRHAEAFREPGGDPALTAEGAARAERLASALGDAGIEVIHTSDYRRTRATAAPLAALLGITPRVYDAGDLAGFAEGLLSARGRHLVLGHSNTNPELVRLLGGEPGDDIRTDEHDRVYILVFDPGAVRTIVVRY